MPSPPSLFQLQLPLISAVVAHCAPSALYLGYGKSSPQLFQERTVRRVLPLKACFPYQTAHTLYGRTPHLHQHGVAQAIPSCRASKRNESKIFPIEWLQIPSQKWLPWLVLQLLGASGHAVPAATLLCQRSQPAAPGKENTPLVR